MWKLVKDNYHYYQRTIRSWLFDGNSKKYSYRVSIDNNNNLLIFPSYNSKFLKIEKDEETYYEMPIYEVIKSKELVNILKRLVEKHVETDFNHRKTKKDILKYVEGK